MRFWVGTLSALGAGLGIGLGLGVVLTEDKFKKEYRESLESYKRAYEMAGNRRNLFEEYGKGGPAATEEDLIIEEKAEIAVVGGEIEKFVPETVNPYHTAVVDAPTMEPNTQGGINDYHVSYIDEEDYLEDDDREKDQIRIIVDDTSVHFYQDQVEIHDWDEKIGDSILTDFYTRVPPGLKQVLYVRNHTTDVDYEVFREMP